jgi:uncharacterized membrane protein YoaK (UPF0700 family)
MTISSPVCKSLSLSTLLGFLDFRISTPAGGTNRNWRRRMTSVGLFMAGAALGGLLLQFGTVWPLVLTSVVFSLAMIPLMFGEKPQ